VTAVLDRILSLLRGRVSPPALAQRLLRAGLADATDLAIVEYVLLHPRVTREALTAWVEVWPWLLDAGQPDNEPEALWARLGALREAGLIEGAPDGGLAVTERLRRLLPGYDALRADAGEPEATLDLTLALDELRLRPEDAPEALLEAHLPALLAASGADPSDAQGLVAEARRGSTGALAVAAALTRGAATGPALRAAMAAAIEALRAAYAPVGEGLTVADAIRLLVLRFADNVAGWCDPAWLEERPDQRNLLRREQVLRTWATYAGLGVSREGALESALTRAARLLEVDHRREGLLAEERAHQRSLGRLVKRRIAAEVKRRDEAARTYASGRRE